LEFELRQFEYATDLEDVLELWEASRPGIQLSASDTPSAISKKLERDPELFLVATDHKSTIVGAVLGGFDGRRGMVYHLAARPGLRRREIGTVLMRELERRLRRLGCLKCYLLVTPENKEAQQFYRRLGWETMDLEAMGKRL
jgi:ribosomal protein S18 acetylase RimI-like enzyme